MTKTQTEIEDFKETKQKALENLEALMEKKFPDIEFKYGIGTIVDYGSQFGIYRNSLDIKKSDEEYIAFIATNLPTIDETQTLQKIIKELEKYGYKYDNNSVYNQAGIASTLGSKIASLGLQLNEEVIKNLANLELSEKIADRKAFETVLDGNPKRNPFDGIAKDTLNQIADYLHDTKEIEDIREGDKTVRRLKPIQADKAKTVVKERLVESKRKENLEMNSKAAETLEHILTNVLGIEKKDYVIGGRILGFNPLKKSKFTMLFRELNESGKDRPIQGLSLEILNLSSENRSLLIAELEKYGYVKSDDRIYDRSQSTAFSITDERVIKNLANQRIIKKELESKDLSVLEPLLEIATPIQEPESDISQEFNPDPTSESNSNQKTRFEKFKNFFTNHEKAIIGTLTGIAICSAIAFIATGIGAGILAGGIAIISLIDVAIFAAPAIFGGIIGGLFGNKFDEVKETQAPKKSSDTTKKPEFTPSTPTRGSSQTR